MKESRLIQMEKNIDTLGAVCKRMMGEIEMLKTLTFGNDTVLKRMTEYKGIIEQLKEEQDERKQEAESDSTTGGDQGTTDTDQ